MAVILVGGGARSGKSRKALELARERGARRVFIATAQAFDDEMRDRIERHREDRGSEFETIEEPLELAGWLRGERAGSGQAPARQPGVAAPHRATVVDCLTLWVSNLIMAGRQVDREATDLIEAATAYPGTLIFVTNEVGCGIVPENELARRFRDQAGRVNQRVGEIAEEVYWMVFGCSLRVK